MKKRKTIMLIVLLLLTVLFCECSSDGKTKRLNKTNVVISNNEKWENVEIIINGTLTVTSGATLALDNVDLKLNPEVEDFTAIIVENSNLFIRNSSIESISGKQWNLEANGNSVLTFSNTSATNHTGIRAFTNTVMNIDNCVLEEVQCHENSTLNITNGSQVYIVLFFNDTGSISFENGELASGDNCTRDFTFKSTAASELDVSGKINISQSDVWGFQLDIEGATDLTINNGIGIVLALHLKDVGTVNISQDITSNSITNGIVDFTVYNGPKLTFYDSQIMYINTYVCGNSDVTFSGRIRVVEANVWDSAKLSFGAKTVLLADLAQAYDDAMLNLNGVVFENDGSNPSITAEGNSVINIVNVNAISGTNVYSVDNGKVHITGGTGWNRSMFEEEINGNITLD